LECDKEGSHELLTERRYQVCRVPCDVMEQSDYDDTDNADDVPTASSNVAPSAAVFCIPSLHGEGSCLWNVNRINAFYDVCSVLAISSVLSLMNKSNHDLFCKLCAPTHALNHLLPPTKNRASLGTPEHSYQLPEYSTDLHKKSFLIRSLYSFVK